MSMSPSPLGHYLSARLAQDEMDSGRAVNFYDVALSANPDNQALLHQTMLLMLAEGRIADAISLAQRRIARHSDAAMARLILASQAIRDNDLATARKHLSKTKRKKFMSLLQPLLLAWINSADDRYSEALTALNHLRKRKAFKPFRTYHSALISDFSGYDAAARESFEETLKGNAWRASRVSLNYGGFLSRQGQRDDALALFNEILERNPNNPVIGAALRKLKAGGTLWPPITTAAQGVAEAFLSAGYAFSGSRGVETARIYSQLALYLRPDLDPARMLLAEMVESEQRYKDAIDIYKEVRASSPLHWSARIRIASNMSSLERVDESITLLRSMAAENPKDTSALI
ncbi:MAG: tetratricopeptide repeat protein, partial [Alphaproteobacteria bacterium]